MKDVDIKFSIVIPVYNKAPYVERAIRSVLNQTVENFELIIVCDPSTDGSEDLVKQIKDSRIRVYERDTPGAGGYAARNLGIQKASFHWIALLDADDMWYPEHLEEIERLIKSYPHKKVFTTSRIIEEKNKVESDLFSDYFQSKGVKEREFSFQEYLDLSFKIDKPFNSNSIVFKRDTAPGLIFPEGKVNRSGDILAWLKLSFHGKGFVWSSYNGSHTYKDVIGVSKTSLPSIEYNFEFAKPLYEESSKKEAALLDKYLNRLVRNAWFEHRRTGSDISPLWSYLRFKNAFFYSLFWSFVSIIPVNSLIKLTNLKKYLKYRA